MEDRYDLEERNRWIHIIVAGKNHKLEIIEVDGDIVRHKLSGKRFFKLSNYCIDWLRTTGYTFQGINLFFYKYIPYNDQTEYAKERRNEQLNSGTTGGNESLGSEHTDSR